VSPELAASDGKYQVKRVMSIVVYRVGFHGPWDGRSVRSPKATVTRVVDESVPLSVRREVDAGKDVRERGGCVARGVATT
jgi:hypothetical protein